MSTFYSPVRAIIKNSDKYFSLREESLGERTVKMREQSNTVVIPNKRLSESSDCSHQRLSTFGECPNP
jgi:hypothetical protein